MERNQLRIINTAGIISAIVAAGFLPLIVGHELAEFELGGVSILMPGSDKALPFRTTSNFEQWLVVISSFVVKPLYMILSLTVIAGLFSARARDLVILRWSMIAFFTGEALCAANYLAFNDESAVIEYLHGYGMVLSFGLCIRALMEGLDNRIIKISDPEKKCSYVPLCARCWKYSTVNCSMRRIFLFFIPLFAGIAFIPQTVMLRDSTYRSIIVNTDYVFRHDLWNQWFEIRFAPALAFVLFIVAFIFAIKLKPRLSSPAQWIFALGVGYLGFGFFRMVIYGLFRDRLSWFIAWEEITELFFVLGILIIILMFRKKLLIGEKLIAGVR